MGYLQIPRMKPIRVKYTVINPLLIKIYFQDFCSKSAIMAKIRVLQPKPARNPAAAPHAASVAESPRKKARLYEMIHEKRKASPYVFAGFCLASCSSVNLVSASQLL